MASIFSRVKNFIFGSYNDSFVKTSNRQSYQSGNQNSAKGDRFDENYRSIFAEIDDIAKKLLREERFKDVVAKPEEKLSSTSVTRNSPKLDTRWYEDDDIQAGLQKNNGAKQGVHVFGAVPTQFSDLLEQSVKTAKAQANKGETALMPFNVNDNHWVGGVMTKVGKEVCFIYNDPMGNPINNSLKKELTAQGIAIIDLQHKQQKGGDAYNCGPFTVDNLTKFAEAAKGANQHGLTKEELTANLRIGLESGIQSGQDLRELQKADAASQPRLDSFVNKVNKRSFPSSSRGAGSAGVNGISGGR